MLRGPRHALQAHDARLAGADLVAAYDAGTLTYTAMGRSGGITGGPIRADVESGSWRDTEYQVAKVHPCNRNWFTISEFVDQIPPRRELTSAEAHELFAAAVSRARSVGTPVFGDDSILDQLEQGLELLRAAPPNDLVRIAALYDTASEAALEARRESSDLWDRLHQA